MRSRLQFAIVCLAAVLTAAVLALTPTPGASDSARARPAASAPEPGNVHRVSNHFYEQKLKASEHELAPQF